MKKILIAVSLLCAGWQPTFAQTLVKSDVMPYFDQAISPALTMQEAYKRGKCEGSKCAFDEYYRASNTSIEQVIKQIAQQTAQQNAQAQQYQALAGQLDDKAMKGMNNAQKAAYVQEKMNQSSGDNRPEGMPSNSQMEFAKQMQDPEFQKKFKSMSQHEQAAYVMQMQNTAPAQTAAQGKGGVKSDPRMQAVMAEMQSKMMNDPKFREKFSKKSEAEQEAYFKEMAKKHGIKDAEMTATKSQIQANEKKVAELQLLVDAQEKGQKIIDYQLKPFLDYQTASAKDRNAAFAKLTYVDSLDIRHSAIEAWKAAELRKLPTHMVEHGEAGREREYVKPDAARALEHKAMEKHIQQVNADLKYLTTYWQKTKQEYKQLVRPFNEALAKAHYGDGYTEKAHLEMLRALAGMQGQMFQYPLALNSLSQSIDSYAAKWLDQKKEFDKKEEVLTPPWW
jgi:hypothetical protein